MSLSFILESGCLYFAGGNQRGEKCCGILSEKCTHASEAPFEIPASNAKEDEAEQRRQRRPDSAGRSSPDAEFLRGPLVSSRPRAAVGVVGMSMGDKLTGEPTHTTKSRGRVHDVNSSYSLKAMLSQRLLLLKVDEAASRFCCRCGH